MGQRKFAKAVQSRAPKSILISANSFWNIANFRSSLIEALVDHGYRVVIATPQADVEWAEARGAETAEIAVDRSGLNPIVDAVLWLDYLRLFRRTGTVMFLGFTAKPNIYGSLAANVAGVSILPNVSGLGTAFMNDGLLSRFVSLLYRLAFRRCPIVFFQNPDDLALFEARGIVRPGQSHLLPGSGVNLDRFVPAAQPVEGLVRFLFVGRLLGDKGVRDFVEAARGLRSEQPHWKFQLLGPIDEGNRSGIKADELREWIEHGWVEHLGSVEDVRPHIAEATAVVLPSYREGMPRSLLEAAAMGRPLVATDVPGNRQIVQEGVNGLLCKPRDPQSLAGALRQMAMMGIARRDEMGRAGRALVEREFGEEKVTGAYLNAVKQLLSPARV
ncbi:glycosyltransferase family 4 protein [Sphingomonas sp. G124]|uniref:Glycosyltransferase family 4 protein n=1 Tax=Sphingomonas cremea TaxID=2904799 RepID=A0A9X1QKF1_9SPHN|nr:glycosyltransferase family 4 protein [Sphingomonas cremea]MCF2514341.1 glycosyltransferase family 4 protein [Sphingomonas cremea]